MTRPYVLLTQDDCAACERLGRMLAGPLRGQFADRIEVVHRQQDAEAFAALCEASHVRSTPALLNRASGAALRDTGSLGAVRAFLSAAD
ncbi:hypothetical protein HNQ07_001959 [Deinococcus metalli]|uniref:Thioredoxin n=1 Tax=Deinococcus metalli TaxID=1141878 RepID=A0A7W8KE40_9DEIO|nr:thioredoxin [Deinococcus metalli]MBB5376495.1 hypothetical protein [Deinococcus metalli]GHF43607.1 thioredoxin [Deinococcus metalli]